MVAIQDTIIKNHVPSIVNVAVAVIHYQDQYLLGFRAPSQHQGNRYEFVGGKIDRDETPIQALIREVAEETGINIANNVAVKLGRLHHDYGDKQVCLQVYRIELTAQQYQQYKYVDRGLEDQKLLWVNKTKLLAKEYDLPAANSTILAWLQLPTQITITHSLTHLNNSTHSMAAWLEYHQEHLKNNTWVYLRLKEVGSEDSINQLLELRPDIQAIIPECLSIDDIDRPVINNQIVAAHLTQSQLLQWSNGFLKEDVTSAALYPSLPLIVSCHDKESIKAANLLAKYRLQHQLPPVIGLFLSPINATQSHPDASPLGWQAWSKLAELADIPVIGLGGLSPMMYKQALLYGGVAVAGIRQFLK